MTITSSRSKEKTIVIDAPNAVITNTARFKKVEVIKAKGYIEAVSGNTIKLLENSHLKVADGVSVKKLVLTAVPLYYDIGKNGSIKSIKIADKKHTGTFDKKTRTLTFDTVGIWTSYDPGQYGTDEDLVTEEYPINYTAVLDKSGRILKTYYKGRATERRDEYKYDENGNRIAVVTMTEGSSLAVDMPLLSGNLSFIWAPGWYHAYPEYDTDSECSFSIVNAEGETIYTSAELEEGVFFSYDPCSVDAVEETTTSSSVNVYPNPTNGMLNIEGQDTMRISVMNVLGQTLQETCSEGNTTLDLSQYESGMYLVRIETENGVMVQKVTIRK
jgi:hypothetical protein